MLSFRGLHKSGLKKVFGRRKTTNEAPPLCSKHRCEITDFECNTWNLVACRRCINLKNAKPNKRCGSLRKEAMHRSSDLIFKILADDNDECVTPVNYNEDNEDNTSDHHGYKHRLSVPTLLDENKNNEKTSDELRNEFNQMHISMGNSIQNDEEQTMPQTSEAFVKRRDNVKRSRPARSVRPPTFVHCVNLDDDEELSVHGLFGQILKDVCEKSNKTSSRLSKRLSVSDYLDFVKKACEEDPSLGSFTAKNIPPNTTTDKTQDKPDKLPVNVTKGADKAVQKSRQSFTALLHLGDEEQEQLLSVHGLLGRVLQDLCKKTSDAERRYSRPVSVADYIDLVKKACESDPSLGGLEENIKEEWILHHKFGLQDVEDATAVASNFNGDFAIADKTKKRVVVFDKTGNFKVALHNPDADNMLCIPRGVATNSEREYFVVDGTKSVKVYDIDCHLLYTFETNAENVRPTCIAIDEQDRVIIGDKRVAMLTVHTSKGELLQRINTVAKPNFLAVNTYRNIFVSDISNGKVHALDWQGNPLFTMDTVIEGIQYKTIGLCCDLTGDIYVTLHSEETRSNPVCRFDQYGKLLDCVAKDLCKPHGLCFTPIEKLLVVDENCVKEYVMK